MISRLRVQVPHSQFNARRMIFYGDLHVGQFSSLEFHFGIARDERG